MISMLASDGLRLGSASAKLAQPSGESPNPCKNIIAALSLDEFFLTSFSSAVELLSAPESITLSVFVLYRIGTGWGNIILPILFVEKAVASNGHTTKMNMTAADNMKDVLGVEETMERARGSYQTYST